MSTLRRAACGKWPPPIAKPSPSPPTAITFRSGFASFTPIAVGNARPCTPWKPYVATKPGETARAADAGYDHGVVRVEVQLRERAIGRRQHAEVPAPRTPDRLQAGLERVRLHLQLVSQRRPPLPVPAPIPRGRRRAPCRP